jgi:flagellar hook-associated protein 3 FlgL
MTTISSSTLTGGIRAIVQNLQAEMLKAEKEVASGRHADAGLTLGQGVREAEAVRQSIGALSTLRNSNAALTVRLEGMQAALGQELQAAQAFTSALLAARDDAGAQAVLASTARANLEALIARANTASVGAHYFGGLNAGQKPLTEYAAPMSPARANVLTAFNTQFGMAPDAAAAAEISPAQMEAFLGGAFAARFDLPSWKADWSTAADDAPRARISFDETVTPPITANAQGFRDLARAYVMAMEFADSGLNGDARRAVIDAAIRATGDGMQGLSAASANLGVIEERVSVTSERLGRALTAAAARSDSIEAADPYEASVRLTALQTKLETAYALTARLRDISLLNYL